VDPVASSDWHTDRQREHATQEILARHEPAKVRISARWPIVAEHEVRILGDAKASTTDRVRIVVRRKYVRFVEALSINDNLPRLDLHKIARNGNDSLDEVVGIAGRPVSKDDHISTSGTCMSRVGVRQSIHHDELAGPQRGQHALAFDEHEVA